MHDELLTAYQRELSYLTELGGEFAKAYPAIAGGLGISSDSIDDPHVSRLVESVAFLNARVRRKLDDDFPELCNGLLQVLYPHYLAPIPSMAITQFVCAPDAAATVRIERHTLLETAPVLGEQCVYRTAYETHLHPVRVAEVTLQGIPFEAPKVAVASKSSAILRIRLQRTNDQYPLAEFAEHGPRFYLRAETRVAHALYELMLEATLEVAVTGGGDDEDAVMLPASCLRPVGFGPDEGVLPAPSRSLPAFRSLTEYFAFPEKFLFIELTDLPRAKLESLGDTLEITLFLNRHEPELEQVVTPETLLLGACPVVNLFEHRSEPVRLDQTQHEVQIVPDARRRSALEVYSVEAVRAVSPQGAETEYRPLYGTVHSGAGGDESPAYYQATRRQTLVSEGAPDAGTDVFLSLVDLALHPASPDDWVLDVRTICTNRNLPAKLPGGAETRFEFYEGGDQVEEIRTLRAPTPTRRPELGGALRWRLISHLSLNHLPLAPLDGVESSDTTELLKETLHLYDHFGSPETRTAIDAVVSLTSRASVMRVQGRRGAGVVRGTELTLDLDEDRMAGSGVFLFASVLEDFLAHYSSVNSFTQLVVRTARREGILKTWPPRAANTALL